MRQPGPVLVIEDDVNDADVIITAIGELGVKNPVKHFSNGQDALEYLMTTADQPFVIISDIRMPGTDGLSLLAKIQETPYLKDKAIPFVFFTGITTKDVVTKAYRLGAQGFYKKGGSYGALKDQLYSILIYWNQCLHPNRDDI